MTLPRQDTQAIAMEAPGKNELKDQFIDLRARGWSYAKIARKLKVSKSTLANWSVELEAQIASLRAIELDSLYEKYYLAKEARIRLLGEQIKSLQDELKKRDLKDIPTEKLIDLQLRYYEVLKEEYTETRPLSEVEIQALQL